MAKRSPHDDELIGLIAELKASRMTQTDVGQAIGASQRSVSTWFSGKNLPGPHYKNAIRDLVLRLRSEGKILGYKKSERTLQSGDIAFLQTILENFEDVPMRLLFELLAYRKKKPTTDA